MVVEERANVNRDVRFKLRSPSKIAFDMSAG